MSKQPWGGARKGAGRPVGRYSRKKRCPCGSNTLKRAKSRKFGCCKKAGLL